MEQERQANDKVTRSQRWFHYLRKMLTRKEAKRAVLRRLLSAVHVGARAVCKRIVIRGVPYLQKTFENSEVGLTCLEREFAARELFSECPWIPPIVRKGPNWFILPFYDSETRLDRVALDLDEEQRRRVAEQTVKILFDIFLAGCAHRDFHSGNLFLVNGQILVTDFEVFEPYPEGARPAFPVSYDIVGRGLESPFGTKNMCYTADDPYKMSLKHVLGIPIDQVLAEMRNELKEDLRAASATFQARRKRHECQAQRIYASFTLPYFTITKQEAQRDCALRLDRFGIRAEGLQGKKILDLGSNVGGMLFEAQKLNPGRCLGVEYDRDKVDVATKIAAYNGLNNVSFMQANIDTLKVQTLGGSFDTVFCLAIEAHVKRTQDLYRLLSLVTRETLYFEGNSKTDPTIVEAQLRKNGFAHVEFPGLSDDDCLAANNCRPLLVARK
ncbi:MAG: methyltransferase domain-containing protein [Planctomycetes bacterium]|nr:methyltransferase domain-containing protein [Planctomycetota bacterium]